MKKRILLTALAGLVLALLLSAAGAEIIETGYWGDNGTWTLDDQGTVVFEGEGALYNQDYPANFWDGRNIRKAVIGDGITTLGGILSGCPTLTSVTIGKGVFEIEDNAFEGCTGLKTITIPKNVEIVGAWAFQDCSSLEEINIEATHIGWTAIEATFQGCGRLTRMNFSPDDHLFRVKNGLLVSRDGKSFMMCPPGWNGVCTIPDGVTFVNEFSFIDCPRLTGITVPDGVTDFDADVCTDCPKLAFLKLPASLRYVSNTAFSNCPELKTVYYGGTAKDRAKLEIDDWGNETLLNARWHLSPGGIETGGVKLKLDSRTKTAKVTGPKNKNVKTIAIPATLKYDGLTYKVTEIAAGAFKNCGKLMKANVGKNVAKIGGKAFYGCGKLKTIILKTEKLTAKTVGVNAFGKTYSKAVFRCPKKVLKAYRKWLPKRGAGKKSIIQ